MQPLNSLWNQIKYLEEANNLVEDKADLRHMGCTEEDIEGYEEFFFEEYFPSTVEQGV